MKDKVKWLYMEGNWDKDVFKCKLDVSCLDANAMFYYDEERSEVELRLTEEMIRGIKDWCEKILSAKEKELADD